jgi:hypothetical protein
MACKHEQTHAPIIRLRSVHIHMNKTQNLQVWGLPSPGSPPERYRTGHAGSPRRGIAAERWNSIPEP